MKYLKFRKFLIVDLIIIFIPYYYTTSSASEHLVQYTAVCAHLATSALFDFYARASSNFCALENCKVARTRGSSYFRAKKSLEMRGGDVSPQGRSYYA